MNAAECGRNYKARTNVERAFRSLKTVDLEVRPIHHRTVDRVRLHIFLCMLACRNGSTLETFCGALRETLKNVASVDSSGI